MSAVLRYTEGTSFTCDARRMTCSYTSVEGSMGEKSSSSHRLAFLAIFLEPRSNFSSTSRQIVFCCDLRLIVRTVTTLPSPRPTMFSSVAQVFSRTDSNYPRAPRSFCCDRKRIESSQNLLTKQTIAREYSTRQTLQYATHFSALSRKRSTNQAACLLIWVSIASLVVLVFPVTSSSALRPSVDYLLTLRRPLSDFLQTSCLCVVS